MPFHELSAESNPSSSDQSPAITKSSSMRHFENHEAVPTRRPVTEADWAAAQLHFKRFGFVYFEDFFSSEEVARVQDWAAAIATASTTVLDAVAAAGDVSLEKYMQQHPELPIVVPEKAHHALPCRAEDFVRPQIFQQFKFIPELVADAISKVMCEPCVLFKEKINFKWPGGGAFPPHQDYPAYDFLQPGDHATAMLSVDAATVANGCLRVAHDWTGSLARLKTAPLNPSLLAAGRVVLPFHKGGKNNGSLLEEYSSRFDWKCLNTRPSDLVIFSSFVPHYSEANNSDAARRAFFLTFNRLSEGEHHEAYYTAKRNDPQNPMFHIATPTVHHLTSM
jgi:ectoine hydroxylase-related dioxygenase (phytanoyl-CoA dioxygenase family)